MDGGEGAGLLGTALRVEEENVALVNVGVGGEMRPVYVRQLGLSWSGLSACEHTHTHTHTHLIHVLYRRGGGD